MLEAADEEDVSAAFESRNIGPVEWVDCRNDPDVKAEALPVEDVLLERTDHQGQVGDPRQVELLLLALGRGHMQQGILLQLGLSFLPQKMEVHGVEHNLRPRREPLHRGHVPCGDLGSGDDHEVEIFTMLLQKRPDGPVIGMMDDLDAHSLKNLLIGRRSNQVVGYEGDVMASPADRADHLEHAQRAGIPIGGGQPVIDHQDLSTRVRLLTMSVDKPERLRQTARG